MRVIDWGNKQYQYGFVSHRRTVLVGAGALSALLYPHYRNGTCMICALDSNTRLSETEHILQRLCEHLGSEDELVFVGCCLLVSGQLMQWVMLEHEIFGSSESLFLFDEGVPSKAPPASYTPEQDQFADGIPDAFISYMHGSRASGFVSDCGGVGANYVFESDKLESMPDVVNRIRKAEEFDVTGG